MTGEERTAASCLVWAGLAFLAALSGCPANDRPAAEPAAHPTPASAAPTYAARMAVGSDALRAGDFAKASAAFRDAADLAAATTDAADAWFYAGEALRGEGRLQDALEAYRKSAAGGVDLELHERFAFILTTTGFGQRAAPHLEALVRGGQAGLQELALFADLQRPVDRREYLAECAAAAPEDPYPEYGLIAHDFWDGRTDGLVGRLRSLVKRHPDLSAPQSLLGEILAEGPPAEFAAWDAALPPGAERWPGVWLARGLFAKRQGEPAAASECFLKSARGSHGNRRAVYQLSQTLTALGHPRAAEAAARADELMKLTALLDEALESEGRHEPALRDVAASLLRLGRVWEACGWGYVARQRFPAAKWPGTLFERYGQQLTDSFPMQRPEEDVVARVELPRGEPFNDVLARLGAVPAERTAGPGEGTFRFEAVDSLDFTHVNGADPSTEGPRMFEQNGGGVGVLDFDGDGRPDVLMTQGLEWAGGASEPTPSATLRDRLYRGRGADGFQDVTEQALPADGGYGQGPAAGDFDGDGFADLYVANFGVNQLLRNLGDGTFEDVSAEAGLSESAWTASAAMADLDGDGVCDLMDANYLAGDAVYTAICDGRACSPSVFSGADNRLLRGDGSGGLRPVLAGGGVADSKSLGLVAVPSGGELAVFVSNDQTRNFLYRAAPPGDAEPPEDALMTGLAYNVDGLPMACMGIAAGDADGDGRLDLFVTNFSEEDNTLYRQDAGGLFSDATKTAGLAGVSWPYVGWGTQFLDADLDGWQDLVLVNGNVDDDTVDGGEFTMRPQAFRNEGGRFRELAEEAGDFFGGKRLGRGLARLDWDGDGRPEFIVSNMLERASVLRNVTPSAGNFLAVRLRATGSPRDAVGATLTAEAGGRSLTRWLTAGDGFQASNERVVRFGLGEADAVDELRVEWPSGRTQTLRGVPAGVTLELVEGSARATVWRDGVVSATAVTP